MCAGVSSFEHRVCAPRGCGVRANIYICVDRRSTSVDRQYACTENVVCVITRSLTTVLGFTRELVLAP